MAALTAIYHVIINRANDAQRRWPRTLVGVILQPHQFSSFNANDPNVVKFPMPPDPEGKALPSADWKAFLDCQTVVGSVLSADPTNGANGYESLPEGAPKPAWCDPAKITCTIGPFRFYKL
jgi:hypothetical protein